MTIEEQQEQIIDDFFAVLSAMINNFHKTFNILKCKPLSEYNLNNKSEFTAEVVEDYT